MATSNIKLFDQNKQNMLSDIDYENNSQRKNGVTTGVASSELHNKQSYQTALVAYAIAQVMLANGYNANDSDAVSTFVNNLSNTMLQKVLDKATTAQAQAGTDTTKYMTPALVNAAIQVLTPSPYKVGDIIATNRTDLGDNWLLCDGREITAAQYPELYPLLDYNMYMDWNWSNVNVQGSPITNDIGKVVKSGNTILIPDTRISDTLTSGDERCLVSTDNGATWAFRSYTLALDGYSRKTVRDAAYYNGVWYLSGAVGNLSSSYIPVVWTSTDLGTWTIHYITGATVTYNTACRLQVFNGKVYVAVVDQSGGGNYSYGIYESSNAGSTWTVAVDFTNFSESSKKYAMCADENYLYYFSTSSSTSSASIRAIMINLSGSVAYNNILSTTPGFDIVKAKAVNGKAYLLSNSNVLMFDANTKVIYNTLYPNYNYNNTCIPGYACYNLIYYKGTFAAVGNNYAWCSHANVGYQGHMSILRDFNDVYLYSGAIDDDELPRVFNVHRDSSITCVQVSVPKKSLPLIGDASSKYYIKAR